MELKQLISATCKEKLSASNTFSRTSGGRGGYTGGIQIKHIPRHNVYA